MASNEDAKAGEDVKETQEVEMQETENAPYNPEANALYPPAPPADADGQADSGASRKVNARAQQRLFDYFMILFGTLMAVSIGWIFHLFFYQPWLPVATGIVGFVICFFVDQCQRPAPEEVEQQNNVQDPSVGFEDEWVQNDDYPLYVQTDFMNESNNSVNILQKMGATRVYMKKGSGALSIEQRTFYKFKNYSGYEIGGAVGSLLGFMIGFCWKFLNWEGTYGADSDVAIILMVTIPLLVCLVVAVFGKPIIRELFVVIMIVLFIIFASISGVKVYSEWWEEFIAYMILLLFTVIGICIGAIIEDLLRKNQWLEPMYLPFVYAKSVSLWEITSIQRRTIGWDHTVLSELPGVSSQFIMERILILWWRILTFFVYIFKFIMWMLWVNAGFVCFIICFVAVCLLFEFTIWKSRSSGGEPLLWIICILCWVLVVLLCLSIWYLSAPCAAKTGMPCATGCRLGKQEYPKVDVEERIDAGRQFKLCICFAISLVCALLAAILLLVVIGDVNNWSEYVEPELIDENVNPSYRIINAQWCTNYNENGTYDVTQPPFQYPDWEALGLYDLPDNETDAPTQTTTTTVSPSPDPTTTPTVSPTMFPTPFVNYTATPRPTAGAFAGRSEPLNEDYPYGPEEEYCEGDRPYLLLVALIFLCICWYLLLFAAYFWNKWDDRVLSPFPAWFVKREWGKFGRMTLATRNSWFTSHCIDLDEASLVKLHDFLNEAVPFYKTHKFIPHQFFSRFRYNDFDNSIASGKGVGNGYDPENDYRD